MKKVMSNPASGDEQILMNARSVIASAQTLEQLLSKSGPPEIRIPIRKDQAQDQAIKPMFQDKTRFGRISQVRRCGTPKPMRALYQGMLTHG
jgi:hypothetical protein